MSRPGKTRGPVLPGLDPGLYQIPDATVNAELLEPQHVATIQYPALHSEGDAYPFQGRHPQGSADRDGDSYQTGEACPAYV